MIGEPLSPDAAKRGSLLNWFLGTSAAALLVSALYPAVRFLIPPKAEESSAASVTLDLKAGEVKPNTGRIVKFGKQPAILLRTPAVSCARSPRFARTWLASSSTGKTSSTSGAPATTGTTTRHPGGISQDRRRGRLLLTS